MISKNTILSVLLLLISACSNLPSDSKEPAEDIGVFENDIEVDVYFCPKDNCAEIIKSIVRNAKSSVHCAFYDLDLEDLTTEIAKKSHDADVKIVIDKNNYEDQIKGPGIRVADSKQYMHNKFCIIDHSKILTGSVNPTTNGVDFNNNNLLVIESDYISKNYEEEFDELWNGIYVGGGKVANGKIASENLVIENYFCPEDNCKKKVIGAIKEAQTSVNFMTFSFTDEDIADAMLFKSIEIKGIFESRSAGSEYSQYKRLKDFGIEVKKDSNPKTMHHKVFIIDRKAVITGSYNPTASGNTRNDENILIIHNERIASKFLDEFDMLWRSSIP
jgi:phosphatidylserine/phosphatidylglycerophosphate/cardiolipin synthase-like enzyme